MTLELFAIGTIGFWCLVSVLAFIELCLVINDEGAWTTLTAIVTICLLNWLCRIPIFHTVFSHPWKSLMWVGIYLAAGLAWSFLKWIFFVLKQRDRRQEFRVAFCRNNNLDEKATFTTTQKSAFQHSLPHSLAKAPNPSDFKSDIIFWMSYWPLSILATLIGDFLTEVFSRLFSALRNAYQGVSNRIWAKMNDDVLE